MIYVGDYSFKNFINYHDFNMSFQDFLIEVRKEKQIISILGEIVDKTFELFDIKFNECIMYEKILNF